MHDDLDRALYRCAHYPPGFRYEDLDPDRPAEDRELAEDDDDDRDGDRAGPCRAGPRSSAGLSGRSRDVGS